MEFVCRLHLSSKPNSMKITFSMICLFTATAMSAQEVDFTVHFDKASAQPDEAEIAVLQAWSAVNAAFTDQPLLLRGHTDADGAPDFNRALSASRNEAVKALLTEAGWKDIRMQPFGETWPLSYGEDEAVKGMDRRVEVVLAETAEEQFYLDQRLSAPEVFHCDALSEIRITTAKGTRVVIPPAVLCDRSGQPVTNARIEVRDFYSKAECIRALLTTSCGSERLESGGMAEIRAYAGNEVLTLEPGAGYTVDFAGPAAHLEGMQLFNGEVKDGWMNWVPVASNAQTVAPAYGNFPELVNQINAGLTYQVDVGITDAQIEEWNKERRLHIARSSDILSGKLGANRFGFINCDRFIKMKKESLRDICVDIGQDTPAGRSFLVFTESNSILRGTWNGECGTSALRWQGVPRDEPMTVIVERGAGDGQILFGHVEIGEKDNYRLTLRPSTEAEMEAFVSGLSK